MTNIHRGFVSLLILVSFTTVASASGGITVDCNKGQSLNQALAKLDKHTANTVAVSGTCTEYVQVIGFQNLTLKGLAGASLVQPSTSSGTLFNGVLFIESSQSVMVSGLNVSADPTTPVAGIGIGHGSTDVRLRFLTVTGGGIVVFENSQVSVAYVTSQSPGYAALAIYDSSDAHVEHCQFTATPGSIWNVGIALGASHVTLYATTITDMQVGIGAYQGSIVDVVNYNTYYSTGGSTDVSIQNPAGANFYGVSVDGGGSLNVESARLVINKAGQTWGGTTGGVLLSDGATMSTTTGNLIINGSNSQGVVALNNAHATLTGATVSGSGHGGLVAANMSTIDVALGNSNSLSTVGGNSVDLFCDSTSWLTGSANIAGKPSAQCTNLLTTETVLLP